MKCRIQCLTVAVLVFGASVTWVLGEEPRVVHTTMKLSTLASDVTTYFDGDTLAFNSALAELAAEYPVALPTILLSGSVLQPSPNLSVYIYKGTGRQHLSRCLEQDSKRTVIHRVPPVPTEVMSKAKSVFDFDWIVTKSSNKTDHKASVILFTGGDVDLFDCKLPANAELKIGNQAIMVPVAATVD